MCADDVGCADSLNHSVVIFIMSLWWADEEHSEECNWRHPFVTLARVRGAMASSIRDGGTAAP